MRWIEYQEIKKSTPSWKKSLFTNSGTSQKSIGHYNLLKRLEEEGYMFTFESPFILPGDDKSGWQKDEWI